MIAAAVLAATAVLRPAQLEHAEVRIELREETARVEAGYRIAGPGDSVRFLLMRRHDQTIHLTPAAPMDRLPRLRERSGLYELYLTSGADPMAATVRYVVRGDLRRIPILLPSTPTDPAESRVRIALTGLATDADLDDAFPRLTPAGSGVAVANPVNLPSFVRLPPRPGSWSTNRIADWIVVLLVVGATAGWVWRRRVVVRRAAAAR